MSHKGIVDKIVQVFLNRLKEGINSGEIGRRVTDMVKGAVVNLKRGDSLEIIYRIKISNIVGVLEKVVKEDSSETTCTVDLNVNDVISFVREFREGVEKGKGNKGGGRK